MMSFGHEHFMGHLHKWWIHVKKIYKDFHGHIWT